MFQKFHGSHWASLDRRHRRKGKGKGKGLAEGKGKGQDLGKGKSKSKAGADASGRLSFAERRGRFVALRVPARASTNQRISEEAPEPAVPEDVFRIVTELGRARVVAIACPQRIHGSVARSLARSAARVGITAAAAGAAVSAAVDSADFEEPDLPEYIWESAAREVASARYQSWSYDTGC